MDRQRVIRVVLAGGIAVSSIACPAGESAPRSARARALEQQLQDGIDRFARVERMTPASLVVTLQDAERAAAPRPMLQGLARRIAREAFTGAAAAAGDTVVIQFRRARRLGPFAFGGTVTRFTYVEPPEASDGAR